MATVTKRKPKVVPYEGNMAIIKVNYNEYVMPFEDGVAVLKHLENAETFQNNYEKGKEIKKLDYDQLGMKLISREEYLKTKMDQLLGVTNEPDSTES